MLVLKNRQLLITGLFFTFLLFNSQQSIASEKFVRIITDEDKIANYIDFNSVQDRGKYRFYTTARIFPKQATKDSEMPLRRPYHQQGCPCSYDFAGDESHCGGRSSGKTTCFAPVKAAKLLILNSVDCKTNVHSIFQIDVYDINGKLITSYSADTITGGAYPVSVKVTDEIELSMNEAVCKSKA